MGKVCTNIQAMEGVAFTEKGNQKNRGCGQGSYTDPIDNLDPDQVIR